MQEIYISIERPYKSLADDKLVEGLQKTNDQRKLQSLQTEFYYRYAPYVYRIALNRFSERKDGVTMAKEVVQDCFRIACQKVLTFTFAEGINAENAGYVVKAWIAKIANNVLLRVLESHGAFQTEEWQDEKETEEDEEQFNVQDAVYFSLDEEIIEVPNEYMIRLRNAMNQLNDKQKDVILAYAAEGCIDSGKHLSEETMEILCKIYNTSPANIRQIKKRALDKIKTLCSD